MPIPIYDRHQYLFPVFGAMLIPSPQHGIFQIAVLIEEKKRMVAIA
jgi:hypothetical protein